MKRKSIDLTDIKEEDLDKTSSFTDLLSRSEKKNRTIEKNISDINDIEDMVEEKKRNTKDLTIELEKAKTKTPSMEISISIHSVTTVGSPVLFAIIHHKKNTAIPEISTNEPFSIR